MQPDKPPLESPSRRRQQSVPARPAACLALLCRIHRAIYAWHSAAAVRRSLLYRHHSVWGDSETLNVGIISIHWAFFFSVRLPVAGLGIVGLGHQAGVVLQIGKDHV